MLVGLLVGIIGILLIIVAMFWTIIFTSKPKKNDSALFYSQNNSKTFSSYSNATKYTARQRKEQEDYPFATVKDSLVDSESLPVFLDREYNKAIIYIAKLGATNNAFWALNLIAHNPNTDTLTLNSMEKNVKEWIKNPSTLKGEYGYIAGAVTSLKNKQGIIYGVALLKSALLENRKWLLAKIAEQGTEITDELKSLPADWLKELITNRSTFKFGGNKSFSTDTYYLGL